MVEWLLTKALQHCFCSQLTFLIIKHFYIKMIPNPRENISIGIQRMQDMSRGEDVFNVKLSGYINCFYKLN